jgi:hypothetical protein
VKVARAEAIAAAARIFTPHFNSPAEKQCSFRLFDVEWIRNPEKRSWEGPLAAGQTTIKLQKARGRRSGIKPGD